MNNLFYKEYFDYITSFYGDVSLVAMKLQEGSQFGYYIIAGNWDGSMLAGYDHSARSTDDDGLLDLDVRQIVIGTYGSVAHLEQKISQYENGEL